MLPDFWDTVAGPSHLQRTHIDRSEDPDPPSKRRRTSVTRAATDALSLSRASSSSMSPSDKPVSGPPVSNHSKTGATSPSSPSPGTPEPPEWRYRLVIIQQPRRARACGFGDKDRRPLSPPPIIQLLIFAKNGTPVHPDLVETSFMILKVDLWNEAADGERNVVMHSNSSTRQISPLPFTRQPLQQISGAASPPGYMDVYRHGQHRGGYESLMGYPRDSIDLALRPSSHTRTPGEASQISDHLFVPPIQQTLTIASADQFRLRPPTARATSYRDARHSAATTFSASRPSTAPGIADYRTRLLSNSPEHRFRPASGSRQSSLTLPPLAAISESDEQGGSLPPPFSRIPTLPEHPQFQWPQGARSDTVSSALSAGPPRPHRMPSWSTEGSRPPTGYSWGTRADSISTHASSLPPAAAGPSPAYSPVIRESKPLIPPFEGPDDHGRDAYAGPYWSPTYPPYPVEGSPSFPFDREGEPVPGGADDQSSIVAPDPQADATYSRVLVGSDVCCCQKLQGEDGKPGIFFFAHDLGVRTEGTFRLRFSFSDLACVMSTDDPGQYAPISAACFSEPFVVYSAKRFPGVIPTTELTRHFAQQNVRLPTRQRRDQQQTAQQEGQGTPNSDGDT